MRSTLREFPMQLVLLPLFPGRQEAQGILSCEIVEQGIHWLDLASWLYLAVFRCSKHPICKFTSDLQCSQPSASSAFFLGPHLLLCFLSRAAAFSFSLLKRLHFAWIIFSSSTVAPIFLGLLWIILWLPWVCCYLFNFLYITRKPTHISAFSAIHRTTATQRHFFFSKAFIPQVVPSYLKNLDVLS